MQWPLFVLSFSNNKIQKYNKVFFRKCRSTSLFPPTHAVTMFFFYIEISSYYKIQESNVFFEIKTSSRYMFTMLVGLLSDLLTYKINVLVFFMIIRRISYYFSSYNILAPVIHKYASLNILINAIKHFLIANRPFSNYKLNIKNIIKKMGMGVGCCLNVWTIKSWSAGCGSF